MTDAELMKKILREEDMPFFSDEDINMYLELNGGKVNDAIYQCLIIKSENSAVSVSGLSTQDTSSYFKRLASRYKPRNSGTL